MFRSGVESVLEGTWQMIRAEVAGEEAPDMVTSKMSVRLVHGAYEVVYAGQISDRGTFQETTSTAQRTLVLQGLEGPNAGRTIPCIFQLKGDRLRVCYGLDGALPGDFTTQVGDRRYLATYRRVPAA